MKIYDKDMYHKEQNIKSIIFIIVVWFVFHTTIISDKNPERLKKLEKKIGLKKEG